MILFLRSLLCQIVFYVVFLTYGLMTPVLLFTNHRFAWHWATLWMRAVIYWWKVTTGSSYEFRGLENLPEGGFIIASKHQSTWETLGTALAIYDVVFVMKQELMKIPVFGQFCAKARMIPIQRNKRSRVIGPMVEAAKQAIDEERKIIIFMEGTRVAAGETLRYKSGVASLANALKCPVVPVALNTGLFWPRNSFWRYQGHVVLQFLPPISPGLDRAELMAQLEEKVEAASNALILETAGSQSPPPSIHNALDALEERGVDVSSVR